MWKIADVMLSNRNVVASGVGAVLGFFIALAGGWDKALETLLTFMLIDIILAVLNSIVFKTSAKSESGALSSRAFSKGLTKKVFLLILVVIGYKLDIMLDIDYIRTSVIIALICNELISILETYKLSGIKSPEVLDDILDVLQKKAHDYKG
jgi:toxin secretion/phage lysis holin